MDVKNIHRLSVIPSQRTFRRLTLNRGTDCEFQCSWGLRRRWRSYWLDHPRRTCLVRSHTEDCRTTRGPKGLLGCSPTSLGDHTPKSKPRYLNWGLGMRLISSFKKRSQKGKSRPNLKGCGAEEEPRPDSDVLKCKQLFI